ncbi:DUF397 domain-containing protein [Streptomyces sp. NPDC050636]
MTTVLWQEGPRGPALVFPAANWSPFVAAVKGGDLPS